MPSSQKRIDIDLDPLSFYAVITDFEKYPEFLDGLVSSRVISHEDDVWQVEQEVQIVKTFPMVLELTGEPAKRLDWKLLESPLLKVNDGSWALEEIDGGRTRATYTLDIQPKGLLIPKKLVAKLAETDMPRMLKAFKRRAEGGSA